MKYISAKDLNSGEIILLDGIIASMISRTSVTHDKKINVTYSYICKGVVTMGYIMMRSNMIVDPDFPFKKSNLSERFRFLLTFQDYNSHKNDNK